MMLVRPPSARAQTAAIAAVLMVAALAACTPTTEGAAPSAEPTETTQAQTILVIGDSIPYNSPDYCPGCTSFPDTLAAQLSESGEQSFVADNRSRYDGAQTADILEQVESGDLDDALADAAIVVVSAGFNDQPPYWEEGEACYQGPVDTDADAIAALTATTSECIATQTAATRAELEGVLDAVRAEAPESTVLALTSYNSWLGWQTLEDAGPDVSAAVNPIVHEALDAWRTAVCESAEAAGGECVDLLEAFNGPEGTVPAGALLADDYTHPSQAGNDLIAERVLAAAG